MKTPFKFHPIHVAVLTILFTPTWSYAQQNQHSASTESYDGQSFYERYYVKHAKKNEQGTTPSAQKYSSYYCQGTWVTPVANNTPVGDLTDSETHIEADYGYYHPTGDSELSGNVVIEQQGRQIRADKLRLDPTHTYATVEGRVELAQDGIVAQGDAVRYNLKEQTGDFENSYYISENTHAHGKASKISRPNRQTVKLNDATYSACAPSASPTWKLQAKEIELNQETGRGITKGTKLYIKDVPVLAVPYFNFPIDDRRTTGLLTPTVGYTNDGGVQLGVPIYLNLAPNYDATLTPRYLSERGAMLDGQFRYLTKNFGEGQIWGGYLPSDNKYNDEDRKDLHFAHQWQINPQWQTGAEYHYASDKDFFSDLSDNPNTYTTLNLRRAWNLSYANGIPGLTANLKVEKFQTLDKNVLDRDRPYARLPQFLLNYTAGNTQGWQWDYHNDTAYFKKSIRDGSALESSGTRLYNKAAVRYNFRRSYGFAIPELSVASINMWYDEDSIANLNANQSQSQSVVVPQFTLDTGLTFEKQGKFLQSISPRAFYAYAPYKSQAGNPNFDSTTASINYDQLFNPSRFYGHDRLDDNNFLSLGVNYRLFDQQGLERLRVGLGQSFFFEDRRVSLLRDVETEKRTGPILSIGSQFNENLSVTANAAWTSSGENAQRDVQFYYTGNHGNLYNLGYYYRNDIPGRQTVYGQAVASIIQPIKDNWRVIGHAQYDLEHDVMRDVLFGINYESCCWGVSVYGRSYYNDLDNVQDPSVKANNAIMAEFTLKGLGGLNNKLSSLLDSRVLGFNKTNQFWTQR